ncbi:hypothetical protein ACLH0M_14690 [Aeromonas media]
MTATKTDWNYHIQNYLERHADSMTLPDYARANSLNLNTARRAMGSAVAAAREARKQGTGDAAVKVQDSGIRVSKTVRRKVREMVADARKKQTHGDHSKGDHLTDHRSTAHTTDLGSKVNAKGAKRTQTKQINAQNGGGDVSTVAVLDGKSNFRDWKSPRQPHAPAMAFGGYASRLEIDDEVLAMAAAMAQTDDDLLISESRLIMMTTRQNQLLRRIAHDYRMGRPWRDDDGNEIPQSQAEAQTLYGPSPHMTQLEAHIGRRKQGIRKQALTQWQAEREAHPLTLAERIERTRQLLQQRAENNLTALETAYLFEIEGIKLPEPLRAEILKEVSLMEPANDMGGGITDEELERQTREYQAKSKYEMEVWVPARQLEIAAIVEQEAAHQAGELLVEDEFARQEEDVILEGRVVLACDDGDWSPEDADTEPEEVW